ncbi:MAG: Stp1/IreP family PP2C-type Ser/Thr phosphatase [Candidatus Hydrogenedentes bacterium]|nr:Stp1/IreP family PP2C-type Ser/Thr phosphatase [Candidatus Hydrogenedentota bacterium]
MAVIPLTVTGPENGGNYEYQWSSKGLQAHLLSDVGKKRAHNEDCCTLCAPDDDHVLRERGLLLAVADGMGGVKGGEFASHLALQTLGETYYSLPNSTIPGRLQAAIDQANRRIFEEAEHNPEYHGMGTTVSAVVILGDYAYIAQVGDSRVYVARGNAGVWQITDDHSLVAEQVRNGYISEDEARKHALKNLITRAVGTKESIKVDLFSFHVKQGDTLLICSDGLSNLVDDREIGRCLAGESLQGAARILVGRALEGGGSDNITAVLLRITKPPEKKELEAGAVRVTFPKMGLFGRLKKFIV